VSKKIKTEDITEALRRVTETLRRNAEAMKWHATVSLEVANNAPFGDSGPLAFSDMVDDICEVIAESYKKDGTPPIFSDEGFRMMDYVRDTPYTFELWEDGHFYDQQINVAIESLNEATLGFYGVANSLRLLGDKGGGVEAEAEGARLAGVLAALCEFDAITVDQPHPVYGHSRAAAQRAVLRAHMDQGGTL
jgi:hypothetical protein